MRGRTRARDRPAGLRVRREKSCGHEALDLIHVAKNSPDGDLDPSAPTMTGGHRAFALFKSRQKPRPEQVANIEIHVMPTVGHATHATAQGGIGVDFAEAKEAAWANVLQNLLPNESAGRAMARDTAIYKFEKSSAPSAPAQTLAGVELMT